MDSRSLTSYCDDLLSVISRARVGDYAASFTYVRMREFVLQLFRTFESEAIAGQFSDFNVQEARFALAAFADETLSLVEWPGQASWRSNPLCGEFFEEYNFGMRFYSKLEGFKRESERNSSLLEIYYVCMCLGYSGELVLYPDKRKEIITDLSKRLESGYPHSNLLSPHGIRPPDPAPVIRDMKLWIIFAVAASIIVVAWVMSAVSIGSSVHSATAAIKQLTP